MEYILSGNFLAAHSIEQLGKKIRALGFMGIDLPIGPGFPCTLKRASRDLVPLVKKLHKNFGVDVPIVNYRADAFSTETEMLYEACGKAEVRYVAPSFFRVEGIDWWDVYEDAVQEIVRLEKLSRQNGVKTLVPLHYGKNLPTTCLAARLLVQFCDPELIRICYDPGVLVIDGEDYEIGLSIIKEYLGIVRVRNSAFLFLKETEEGNQKREIAWISLKDGIVSWPTVLDLLESIGYSDIFCFHTEYSDMDRLETFLASDLEYIHNIMKERNETSKKFGALYSD